MGSKAIVFLGLFLAVVLLITSEVQARDLAESTTSTSTTSGNYPDGRGAYNRGRGHGNYEDGRGGYNRGGGHGNYEDGRGGYNRGGGGGHGNYEDGRGGYNGGN